ncbi:MAG: GHKL domain-containing protein [Candidatus Latescibacteria bacterium]|nr:GHKL domain-containing protein [bacterium]MBD3425562.1 GHKL domain-containing protein [Candidatus Latescibacterota bacterium]
MGDNRENKIDDQISTCWKYFDCDQEDCPAHDRENAACWELTGHTCKGRVFGRIEEKLVKCCFNCDFFKQLKKRIKGRRWADITILETLEDALQRSSNYSEKVEDLYMEVIRRSKLMNLLSEVSRIISGLDSEEDIILAILTIITANEGLGYNRAFVFLKEEDREVLRGKYALGPADANEASDLWHLLEKEKDMSIEKLVRKGQRLSYIRKSELAIRTSKLTIDMSDENSAITKGLSEVQFLDANDLDSEQDRKIARDLKLQQFCFCPIATADEQLGLVFVDNLYSGRKITAEDAHLLEVVISHAATSLKVVQLKESLNKNIKILKESYRKLKMNEDRMMKAERLAITGEMTSSVLHEIKNPLVSIGGFARSLLRSEELSGKDRESVEVIANESLRLEKYLKSLQSSVSEVKLEEENINNVLKDTFQMLKGEMKERKINLVKNLDPDLSLVRIDEVKMHEVMMNIIKNSIEAVDEGGTIEVKSWNDGNKVFVQVRDDGEGIQSDRMNRIFSPFYTTKDHGSGLGLAFAHRIIKDHGGNITVSSASGKGATFTISVRSVNEDEKVSG